MATQLTLTFMLKVYVWIIVLAGVIMVRGTSVTQAQLDDLSNSMVIQAKVIENLRHDGQNHTVRLTISNTGNKEIPADGWRLYFHSMYLVQPNTFPQNMTMDFGTEKIRLGMVQGDLYYLEPIDGFVPIKQNEMREYYIVVAWWSVSRTDFMPNWYLTSNGAEPRVVESTNSLDLEYVESHDDVRAWKRFAGDRYNPYSAQERMRLLATEDTGKVERLVMPTPKRIEVSSESSTISVDGTWSIYTDVPDFETTAQYLQETLGIQFVDSKPARRCIILRTTEEQTVTGAYRLEIDTTQPIIYLTSHDSDGIFYASQSLRSILDGYNKQNIPGLLITDEPRYQYRGMHIDVARNFHTVDDIKRLMTAMAMYKLNKLHLHLSDDEGWRVEIPDLPELTEIGGRRCHDLEERMCVIPQFGSGPFHNSTGSGFYSADEYKDLLRFAVKNHIQVIPEFDMPGHAHAAIVSMEERYRKYRDAGNETEAERYSLVDPNDQSVYISVQQWLDNALNPCINSSYDFIGKVMDDMIELHKDIQPLQIYHFGGDEVADGAWEMSPVCEDLIKNNPQYKVTKGIKTYFVQRVSKLAADRNINLAGWEDGLTDGKSDPLHIDTLSTNHTYVNAWNNIWEWGGGKHAYQLANAGYKVILAQATNVFFDHPQEPDPEERGLYWATRFTDTKKVLKFMPDTLYDNIFEERSGKPTNKYDICGDKMEKCDALEKDDNILGIQGELWSETVRTSEDMDYMIFPRLLALAERAWYKADFEDTSDDNRDGSFEEEWKSFANTLGHKELRRLDNIGVKYRVPPPAGRVNGDKTVELSSIYPGLGLQSSTDGGNTWFDVQQDVPLQWNDQQTFHVRTVSTSGNRFSRVIQIFKDEPTIWTDQHLVDYIADNIAVHVHVVDNVTPEDGYVREYLSLRNDGNSDIPRGTWRIYHNSLYGKKDEELECGLRNYHVKGGLYYLTPNGNKFNPLKAGTRLECEIHNRNSLAARSDYMPNWYVTSFGMRPREIISTKGEAMKYVGDFNTELQWKHSRNDRYQFFTNELRYNTYKMYTPPQFQPYTIIPTPWNVTSDFSETMMFISTEWKVVNSSDFTSESSYLAGILHTEISKFKPFSKVIEFIKTNIDTNPESYLLDIDITLQKITITTNTASGAFYGVQTLVSLIEGNDGTLIKMTIFDKPRYTYRGLMLDTARNFKPVEWILKMIDVIAVYKLNKLHLHLSDDEGWRLEMPSIPELTEVGSQRCQSDYKGECIPPQLGSGPDNTTSGTGFYTLDDYKNILKYANDRHVELIPEIDTPGHSSAAIAAMNYRESRIEGLTSHGAHTLPVSYLLDKSMNQHAISSPLKWPRNAIDPCLNTSYEFISQVLDDLIDMHKHSQPLKTVHVGGDEVPEGVWEDSQACGNAGIRLGTKQLHKVFEKRVADIVASKGLNLAVWDDGIYAEEKPNSREDYKSDNVYVYTWDNRGVNTKRVSEFADAGFKVVLPLATHLYFDHTQDPDPEERGLYWATRFTDTQKTFGLMPDNLYANIVEDNVGNPVDVNDLCENKPCPKQDKTENVIGLEGTMFSETMRTEEQVHYMGFPRILALAERAWHKASWEDVTDVNERNSQRDADWKEFSANLGYKELSRLDKRSVYYRLPPPGAIIEDNWLKVNTKYPNLLVERSVDHGKSWVKYTDSKLPPGSHTYLLRTKSKTGNVYSRSVEVTVVASASTSSVSLLLMSVIILFDIFNWRS